MQEPKSVWSRLKVVKYSKRADFDLKFKIAARKSFITLNQVFFNIAKSKFNLTLAPIWLPHWPAWRWTISLIFVGFKKEKFSLKYHDLMGLLVPLNFSRQLRGVKETQLQSERGRAYFAPFVRQLAWVSPLWYWVGGRRGLVGPVPACARAKNRRALVSRFRS